MNKEDKHARIMFIGIALMAIGLLAAPFADMYLSDGAVYISIIIATIGILMMFVPLMID